MGKKDKAKKKVGKGAEKTAEKTEKKLKLKLQKATGENDIESIVKAIEDEEKKRQSVKEVRCDPPSHRSNLSMVCHPECPEMVFFGGEFYDGRRTLLNNDLLFYDIKRKEWRQIKSPGGPPPRCSHQAVVSSQGGGQMWVFGGEYASPSETQFHHYKDLWCYYFSTKRWEKIPVPAEKGLCPSARSGHRMVLVKRHLIIFGGFNDSLRGGDSKYFNDVHVFDTQERVWKRIDIVGGCKGPSPRSGCNMLSLADGRILVYGGYCKEKSGGKKGGKKGDGVDEVGKVLSDMFLLVNEKHDETMMKWRWYPVKQTGHKPCPRSGFSAAAIPNTFKILFFGGVQDDDGTNTADMDSDDEEGGVFFNDLYSVQVEGEKATWQKVELAGSRGQKKSKNEMTEDEDLSTIALGLERADVTEDETKVVECGAFTITSTISSGKEEPIKIEPKNQDASKTDKVDIVGPSPRFGSQMALRQGILFLFGGMVEDDDDRQLTFNDFYSLDVKKMEAWETIIESDIKALEDSEDSADDEEDDSSDEMDTD